MARLSRRSVPMSNSVRITGGIVKPMPPVLSEQGVVPYYKESYGRE